MERSRDIVKSLAVKCNGDWDKMMYIIKRKIKIEDSEIVTAEDNEIAITDETYPDCLKSTYKPPLIIRYIGNIGLINSKKKKVACGTLAKSRLDWLDADFIPVLDISDITFNIVYEAMKLNKTFIFVSPFTLESKAVSSIRKYCENKDSLIVTEAYNKDVPLWQYKRLVSGISDELLIDDEERHREYALALVESFKNIGKDVKAVPHDPSDHMDLADKLLQEGCYPVLCKEDIVKDL